jgi:hypothetical protein
MKWLLVVLLAIVGLLAAFVAIEYFTVSIHSLPSYIPGHKNGNGHYHVRGAMVGLIAIVALAGAAVLAIRIVRPREPKAAPVQAAPTNASADQLLGSSEADPKA